MQLLTKALRRKLPKFGTTDIRDPDTVVVAKFFTPDGGWTWFATEFDGDDLFFGLVIGFEAEFGSFRLSELQSIRGKLGLPVERDRWFEPTRLETICEHYAPNLLFEEDMLRAQDRDLADEDSDPF